MNKILSIIVPTYNMESYLHKCLDSLIVSKENMERLEVLVINDGSTDSSSQIAHEYEAKYPQTFRIIDKENGNYGSCINRGLEEVTGKYVKVLDADDCFVAEVQDKFIDYLQDTDVDLVLNDFVTVDENDAITEFYTFNLPKNKIFTLQDIPKPMIEWIWHQGITYKTNILKAIDYHQTEGISYTDDEWIFMPMYKVESVSYFPCILYHYLLGREGQTFAPIVMKSSFDKRIIVGKSLVQYFASFEQNIPTVAKSYMIEKLRSRLSVIYNFYLTKEYSREGNEHLKEFDLFIKRQSQFVYDLLAQRKDKLLGKNYINEWRLSNYESSPYLFMRRIKFRMRLLFGKQYRNIHMPDNLRRQ